MCHPYFCALSQSSPPFPADEHRDIVDWATYHEARGIDKIYIIDMGLDSMQPELEKAGLIQVWLQPGLGAAAGC